MSVPCRVLRCGSCEITDIYEPPRHGGIDLVKEGFDEDWIVAHSDGVVVANRTDCKGFEPNGSYGNYVKIKHDNGYYTFYAHLRWDTVQVDVGTKVKKGDLLGFQGATGTAYGTHLHFEVRTPDDVRIDPTPYIDSELPNNVVITPNVEKDLSKDQVNVLIDYLRVRTTPSLNGYILGFTSIGYYNVLEQVEADGYTWFKIAEDNYIAYSDEWAEYYPKTDVDYKKLFDELLVKYEDLCVKYEESINTNNELNEKINKAIEDLT